MITPTRTTTLTVSAANSSPDGNMSTLSVLALTPALRSASIALPMCTVVDSVVP